MDEYQINTELIIEVSAATAKRLGFLVETGIFDNLESAAEYMVKNATDFIFDKNSASLY